MNFLRPDKRTYRNDLTRFLERTRALGEAGFSAIVFADAVQKETTQPTDNRKTSHDAEESVKISVDESKLKSGAALLSKIDTGENPLPSFQYNLACAYSRWAEALDTKLKPGVATLSEEEKQSCLREHKKQRERALDRLNNALWLNPKLRSEALADPSLQFLQSHDETTARFWEIIDRTEDAPQAEEPKAPANPLSIFSSIGKVYGTRLAVEGATDVSSLVSLLETRSERRRIANKFNIGELKVLEWAKAIELAKVRGLELKDLDLLAAAGIRSIADLAGAAPRALHERVSDWCKSLAISPTPKKDEVKRWIDSAETMSSLIRD